MTLRSRLSAAWKAFKRDDFPPTVTITGVTGVEMWPPVNAAGYCRHCLANGYVNDDHCPARVFRPSSFTDAYGRASTPVRLDLKANTNYNVHAPVDMPVTAIDHKLRYSASFPSGTVDFPPVGVTEEQAQAIASRSLFENWRDPPRRHEVATPFGSISFDNAEDAAMASAFNDAKQRQVEHDAEIHSALMSPHPLPTIVDETEAIHAEEQRELSKLTPDWTTKAKQNWPLPEPAAEIAISDVWYEDTFGNLWSGTVKDGRVVPTGVLRSGVSNLEVPAIIRKRRKKLVSVPKE